MSWRPPEQNAPSTDWSLYPALQDVDFQNHNEINVNSVNFGPLGTNVLDTVSNALYYNGFPVGLGGGAADWADFPAVNNVNVNGFTLTANSIIPGQITIQTDQTIDTKFLQANSAAPDATTRISTNAKADLRLLNVGAQAVVNNLQQPYTALGSINELQNQLNVGDTTNKAGIFHVYGPTNVDASGLGFHAGTLTVAGVDTQRLDITPLGINITSATAATMNATAAIAFSAGSDVVLEHGNLGAVNAVFVQNIARNANAEMNFSFGGSIKNLNAVNFAPSGEITNLTTVNAIPWAPPQVVVLAAGAGTIDCLPAGRGSTICFSSGTVQNFTATTLGVGDAGWYAYIKNSQNRPATGGNDITINFNGVAIGGPTGTSVLHTRDNTNNTGQSIIYWTGTALELI